MSTDDESVALDPSYIAGLLDSIGRVRFDISDTQDGRYTVRPMLRLKHSGTDLRAAVVGEFLEERGYQYEFVERHYGREFFRLQQASDLEELEAFLAGHSSQLVRELAFVNGVFADEFGTRILDPRELYQFTITRDRLRHGWRPRGRYHRSPADVVESHEFSHESIDPLPVPEGDVRTDYAVEWIAGVFDGACRYRPSVAEDAEYSIGYSMYPIARLYCPGVCPEFVDNFRRFCDDYDLAYGDSSDDDTLRITFTSATNIRRVLDVIFPRLLVLADVSEVLLGSILPRFDENEHRTRQGFYDLLRDFDSVARATGGQFREREYTPDYFADRWREDLDLVDEDEAESAGEPADQRGEFDVVPDVSLSGDDFAGPVGRYRTLVDLVDRDPESVARLRELYDDRCQLCGLRLADADGTGYAEVHYVRPLAPPHDGTDEPSNMLVVCPNHHADLDNGIVRIDPETGTIEHPFDSDIDETSIDVEPEHALSEDRLRYHNENICRLR